MRILKAAALAVILSCLSLPVQAMSIGFNFSGNVDESVGDFMGMISIDDAQAGADNGFGTHEYNYTNLMLTFDDGAEITEATGSFGGRQAGPLLEVLLSVGSDPRLEIFWHFADSSFDKTNIFEVLGALTGGTLLSSTAVIYQDRGDCRAGCDGTVTNLTEKSTSLAEPGTLWMLLLGFSVIATIRWSIPK